MRPKRTSANENLSIRMNTRYLIVFEGLCSISSGHIAMLRSRNSSSLTPCLDARIFQLSWRRKDFRILIWSYSTMASGSWPPQGTKRQHHIANLPAHFNLFPFIHTAQTDSFLMRNYVNVDGIEHQIIRRSQLLRLLSVNNISAHRCQL